MYIPDFTAIQVFRTVSMSLEMTRAQHSTGKKRMRANAVPPVQEVTSNYSNHAILSHPNRVRK